MVGCELRVCYVVLFNCIKPDFQYFTSWNCLVGFLFYYHYFLSSSFFISLFLFYRYFFPNLISGGYKLRQVLLNSAHVTLLSSIYHFHFYDMHTQIYIYMCKYIYIHICVCVYCMIGKKWTECNWEMQRILNLNV